jgi:hypothetical protein
MRQAHSVPKITRQQLLLETLAMIQILCARGASLERIHELAERAISLINSRH